MMILENRVLMVINDTHFNYLIILHSIWLIHAEQTSLLVKLRIKIISGLYVRLCILTKIPISRYLMVVIPQNDFRELHFK